MNTPTREIPPLDRELALIIDRRRRLSQGLTVDAQFDDAFLELGIAVGSKVVSIRGKVAQPLSQEKNDALGPCLTLRRFGPFSVEPVRQLRDSDHV